MINKNIISTFLFTLGALAACAPESAEFDTGDTGVAAPGDNNGSDNNGSDNTDDAAQTIEYGFDAQESLLYVQVFKDTSALGSSWAHDHVIRAADFEGEVLYNADDIGECEVNFTMPVDSLIVDESDMRSLVGYGDEISSDDRATIREHMMADDQLNSDRYSEITFASTSCELTSQNSVLVVNGGLTVRGTTANVSIDVPFSVQEDKFYAESTFEVKHADFGMEPYSAYGGFVRNDDPLTFSLEMVGFAN